MVCISARQAPHLLPPSAQGTSPAVDEKIADLAPTSGVRNSQKCRLSAAALPIAYHPPSLIKFSVDGARRTRAPAVTDSHLP